MPIKYKYGKITKLPRDLDPNILILRKVIAEYEQCPFCHSKNTRHTVFSDWYQTLGSSWWQFWKRNWCSKLDFTCNDCGAKWESPLFPQDVEIDDGCTTDINYFLNKYGVELKNE